MARDLRYLVLAEGQFGPMTSKTANGCIRYSPERVAAVLDSRHAGQTAAQVIGYGGGIPVVATVEEGLRLAPNALLIGIAPTGGKFPEAWRSIMRAAISSGLEIWSGLHSFISEDPEFAALATQHGVAIHDLRKPPADLPVAAGRVREVASTVILTVGTDCNIGKMTASLQLRDGLRKRNRSVAFAGTGQTGILIEGWGISVDAVIADFIAGASERLTLDAAKIAEIVMVEGQGSLVHPGYSGVTYGLMQGSLPHAMIMCAQPSRTAINNNPWVTIPPLPDFIALHERILEPLRPSKTIAVALNTYDLSEQAARAAIARTEDETGLPATDPVRFDPAPLVDAIEHFHVTRAR